jgi:rod shape-determining protein MreD
VRRPAAVRVIGPLQWIVYPSLVALAVTVVLGTPVQLFGLTLPEPVIPMVLAFAWPLIRPSMLAPAVLFGLGVFLDMFWRGPLGLWPLALMAVYGVILLSRNLLAGHEGLVRFGWYAACTVGAFSLAYVIVALRAGNPPAILPLIGQITPTLMLYPAANWLLERFDDGDTRFR